MRTQIAIGVIFIGVPDNADLQPSRSDDAHCAVGYLSVLTNTNFRHFLPFAYSLLL